MFGCWPLLPTYFYFPMMWGTEKHWHVNCYIAKLCEGLWEVFKEAQAQSTSAVERQKCYYDRKANVISLGREVTWSWLKLMPMGEEKVKDWWDEEPYEVEHQVAEEVPSYLMKNQQMRHSWVPYWNWLFLITPAERTFVWSCKLSGPSAASPP